MQGQRGSEPAKAGGVPCTPYRSLAAGPLEVYRDVLGLEELLDAPVTTLASEP
jgi:hypothetical protein